MICFAWDGFPQYAARCIGAFVASTQERVVVVATRPFVPIEGMEKLCGCPVVWVDVNDTVRLKDLIGEMPSVLFVSGWGIPVFNLFCDEARGDGCKVIAMIDHNLKLSLKEVARAVRFRLFLRHRFFGFFVPGRSGVRLLRFYGVDRERIATGMYSADASLFAKGRPLQERDRRIIYVGQFIERKNVLRMVSAFRKANGCRNGNWSLHLYGSGPLQGRLEGMSDDCVKVHSFVQPEQLAGLYQEARAFCLPSLEEHWGLVVHEAALSGCVLLLSKAVGAAEDLLCDSNGISFSPTCEGEMVEAFRNVMEMSDDAFAKAYESSLRMAKAASVEKFVNGVQSLIG